MLEITRSTTFVPGANLRGEVAGANWMFLRPSLEAGQIICIGLPPPTTLVTLAHFSQTVTILCRTQSQMDEVSATGQQRKLNNLQPWLVGDKPALPLPANSVDLVFLVDWPAGWWLRRDGTLRTELRRLLKPEGLLYYETYGLLARLQGGAAQKFSQPDDTTQNLWLTPLWDELHTAVPSTDPATIRYFLRQNLVSPSFDLQRFKRVLNLLKRKRGAHQAESDGEASVAPVIAAGRNSTHWGRLTQRSGRFVGGSAQQLAAHPPQYLCSIAQEAGLSLENFRWGLAAPGAYSSRKLLFFLFDRDQTTPDAPPTYIVKMVRHPMFNARLENEYQALTALWQQGIGQPGTLPQAVFGGHHAGLALVGETIIEGTPFRQRTKGTADCPYAQAALTWLTDLGAASADPTATTPQQTAEQLGGLLTRFTEIYNVAPAHRTFLAEQMATLANSSTAMPLVFQHGDPGPWNVMATATGRIAFLDWEAFEAKGVPLWDLFYFLRSYCVGAARTQGTRNTLTGFAQQFLAETPLSHLVIAATAHYCQRVGLAANLVEPLFYLCWVHRSLKEATRLTPKKLENGHYLNLIRLCIEQRQTFTLNRLFN
ncbi:MAG: phosphotransferase [Chloroflexi bacterium]|nr:phosphotransferase [Chloroflexota bacterium]